MSNHLLVQLHIKETFEELPVIDYVKDEGKN